MLCGIHQGGYLSLIKYAVFINSLLVDLQSSGLCSVVHGYSTTPLGYADDIASACTSRRKIDGVMDIVYLHSTRWRYQFNSKKSAVLVYGEGQKERVTNSAARQFKLGYNKIPEKLTYDHVGVKCSVLDNNDERTKEKIAKGRKALGAASGIGVKRGGVSMQACNLVFWSFIVPIVTYGAELWVMTDNDVILLDNFQRYAGRRLQRFSAMSPSQTSYACLGWVRLELFAYVKKLLFVRTIVQMEDDMVYKKLLLSRTHQFNDDIETYVHNEFHSPIFEILRASILFEVYRETVQMIFGIRVFSKVAWRDLVWEHAWRIEYSDWRTRCNYFKSLGEVRMVMDFPQYCSWWHIADVNHCLIRECETMVRLICKTSDLRCDDPRLKDATYSVRSCSLCDSYALEDPQHIIMQCAYIEDERRAMFDELENIAGGAGRRVIEMSQNIYWTLMGRPVEGIAWVLMIQFLSVVAVHVHRMIRKVVRDRVGIG